jgi:hypothetical protein
MLRLNEALEAAVMSLQASPPPARRSLYTSAEATSTPRDAAFAAMQPPSQLHYDRRAPSPTEEALRRDLDVANRAVSDLWSQAHRIGGGATSEEAAGGGVAPLAADVVTILEDEIALRMDCAAEMHGDAMGIVAHALRTANAFAKADVALRTAREDAIRVGVERCETVKSAEAAAAAAEKRCRELETELASERTQVRVLQEEVREMRSAKALQEVVWSTERERLRYEVATARAEAQSAVAAKRRDQLLEAVR